MARLLLAGSAPVPGDLADIARPVVQGAKLRFRLFREDLERVESEIVGMMKQGEISRGNAQLIWLDRGYVLSAPLIERYLAAGECGKVADWLRARTDFHQTGWLDWRNVGAIDGFARLGKAEVAVELLMKHLGRVIHHVKQTARYAGQDLRAADELGHGKRAQDARDEAIRRVSGSVAAAEIELAEAEDWISANSPTKDQQVFDDHRRVLSRVRKRFKISETGL